MDQAVGAVCGILHAHHAGALFTGFSTQQGRMNIDVQVAREKIVKTASALGSNSDSVVSVVSSSSNLVTSSARLHLEPPAL